MPSNGYFPDSVLAPIAGGGRLAIEDYRAPGKPGPAAAWNAMAAFIYKETGQRIAVTGPDSSYRSYPRQVYYWNLYQSGQGNPAAYPGTSNHGMGINVDVPQFVRYLIDKYGAQFGWSKSWSDAQNEWWHITYQAGHYSGKDPGPGYVAAERYPTLRKGDRGHDVVRLQRHLRRWNIGIERPAKADGDFGEQTRKAVVQFQYVHDLTPDGVVGKSTWKQLRRKDPLYTSERTVINRLRLLRRHNVSGGEKEQAERLREWCAKRAHAIVAAAERTGWDKENRRVRFRVLKEAAPEAFKNHPDLNEQQTDLYLELASRYQLDPFRGEIYAALMPGRDGEPGKFTPIVGKDGHLSIAQRHPSFRGVESDVVREFDHYEVLRPGPGEIHVNHRYQAAGGKPGEGKDAAPVGVKQRGRIIGAWAVVHRADRVPVYFFAPWGEYAPKRLARAWRTHPSAMIRKCAVVNALREQFSLSGLYADVEMDRVFERQNAGDPAPEPEWGGDPETAEQLRRVAEGINSIKPGTYLPAKLRSLLAGANDDERQALLADMERELDGLRGDSPPQAPQDDADGDEDVVDAEVVGEGEAGPEDAPEGPAAEDAEGEPPEEPISAERKGDADPNESALADVEDALAGDELTADERAECEAKRDALIRELGQTSLVD